MRNWQSSINGHKITFRTNIDLERGEDFAYELRLEPRVGDIVRSKMKHSIAKVQIQLEVIAIYHSEHETIVELSIPKYEKNIAEFQIWYQNIVRSVA